MRIVLLLLSSLMVMAAVPAFAATKTAVFAGGCFWCMESEFQEKAGVSDVVSGYAGGEDTKNAAAPTYEQVSSGRTGFKEAVQVTYDPSVVTYQQLLDIFWRNVDPFDDKGQFCDKGSQYVAAVFYGSPEEQKLAQNALKKIEEKFKQPVATQILPAVTFFAAEEHHQDFYKNSALHYKLYRSGCGRDDRLKELNGPSPDSKH